MSLDKFALNEKIILRLIEPAHRHRCHQSWQDSVVFSPGLPTSAGLDTEHICGEVMSHTLNKECKSSSTGTSLSWPFFALPMAVRLANVMTTSSGFFCRITAKPPEFARVEAARANAEEI